MVSSPPPRRRAVGLPGIPVSLRDPTVGPPTYCALLAKLTASPLAETAPADGAGACRDKRTLSARPSCSRGRGKGSREASFPPTAPYGRRQPASRPTTCANTICCRSSQRAAVYLCQLLRLRLDGVMGSVCTATVL